MIRLPLALALATALAGGPSAGCVSAEGPVLTSGDPGGGADGGLGGEDCGNLVCPAAGPDEVVVCGRALSLATSQPMTEAAPAVRLFDLVDLEADPAAAPRVEVQPDSCGRFAAAVELVSVFAVVTTGEHGMSAPYRRVVASYMAQAGEVLRANAYALAVDTDVAWSQSAGLGDTGLTDPGAVMAIFVDSNRAPVEPFAGTPLGGVTLTLDGAAVPASDFYFSDSAVTGHTALDPGQTATGPSGAGVIHAPPQTLGTYAGESPDCVATGASVIISVPASVQVQEIPMLCL